MSMRPFQLRTRHDRQAKQARCSCGWVGPWRTTPPTGHRRRDAQARYVLTRADYKAHYTEAHSDEPTITTTTTN